MFISETTKECLQALGERLRSERLRRNETQKIFAARVGTSTPTLLKMETGDPKVQFGSWAAALDILNRISDLDQLLAPPEDLFAKYDLTRKKTRQRASRRKSP